MNTAYFRSPLAHDHRREVGQRFHRHGRALQLGDRRAVLPFVALPGKVRFFVRGCSERSSGRLRRKRGRRGGAEELLQVRRQLLRLAQGDHYSHQRFKVLDIF